MNMQAITDDYRRENYLRVTTLNQVNGELIGTCVLQGWVRDISPGYVAGLNGRIYFLGWGRQLLAGVTYTARSACDHTTVYAVKVISVSPTRKSALIEEDGERKRVKIHRDGDEEFIYPHGRYSMAAIIRASRPQFKPTI